MIKKIIAPFIFFIQEFRRDNAFRKQAKSQKMKSMMLGAMGQYCIILFGLLIMYYSFVGYVIIMFMELEPYGLLALGFIIFIIWAWTSFAKKILVSNKIKYLKQHDVYEQYKEASKHIN